MLVLHILDRRGLVFFSEFSGVFRGFAGLKVAGGGFASLWLYRALERRQAGEIGWEEGVIVKRGGI